ncbi:MAG TPA: disulfide bond formation protein B [Acidimicrobiales bacterium]|nr:disulfide bond formation protein B [Acidimicrobiales bacterium]
MSTETGTLFLALLAIASQVSILAVLVLAATARPTLARVRAALGEQALQLAFVVALVATAGSLWLSEGAHFVPCRLCWYQRIAMYPMAVILGIAAWRRDVSVRVYALPVVAIGATISVWHMLIERFPSLESASSCDPANPCSLIWVERFGYLTIPTMAFTAFALIATLLLLAPKESDG